MAKNLKPRQKTLLFMSALGCHHAVDYIKMPANEATIVSRTNQTKKKLENKVRFARVFTTNFQTNRFNKSKFWKIPSTNISFHWFHRETENENSREAKNASQLFTGKISLRWLVLANVL